MKRIAWFVTIMVFLLALVLGMEACQTPADSTQSTDAAQKGATYTVMAPNGAPALALSKMMKDNAEVNNHPLTYSVIGDNATTTLPAHMETGDADFIIAPTNVGVQKAITNGKYYLLGVTSWGNLYIVTTNDAYKTLDDEAYASMSDADAAKAFLSQFADHSISSIGQNQVPDKTIKELLKIAEVTCTVANSETAGKIQDALIQHEIDCALLGEPAVTATKAVLAKNSVTGYRILGSVSALWQSLTGLAYPQAGIFVKKSVVEAADGAATVAAFETALTRSIEYLNAGEDNAAELGNYMESRGDNTIKGAIIKQCYLRCAQSYRPAAQCKEDVKRLVAVLVPTLADQSYDQIFYNAQ